jgi:hypothetical protein
MLVLALWHDRRRKQRTSQGGEYFFVRPRPPGSHYFKNLVVLAVVIALGWFVWYVMGTRCHGAC